MTFHWCQCPRTNTLCSLPPHLPSANRSKSLSNKVKIVHKTPKTRSVYQIKVLTSKPYNHAVNKLNFQHSSHFLFWKIVICHFTGRSKLLSLLGIWYTWNPFSHHHIFSTPLAFTGSKYGVMMGKILLPLYTQMVVWALESDVMGSNSSTPHKLPDLGKRLNSLNFGFLMSTMGCVARFKWDNEWKCLAQCLAQDWLN